MAATRATRKTGAALEGGAAPPAYSAPADEREAEAERDEWSAGYWRCPNSFYDDGHYARLGDRTAGVYLYLLRLGHMTRKAWPGVRKLKVVLRKGAVSLKHSLDVLERDGYIRREKRGPKSTQYTILNLPRISHKNVSTVPTCRNGYRSHIQELSPFSHAGTEEEQGKKNSRKRGVAKQHAETVPDHHSPLNAPAPFSLDDLLNEYPQFEPIRADLSKCDVSPKTLRSVFAMSDAADVIPDAIRRVIDAKPRSPNAYFRSTVNGMIDDRREGRRRDTDLSAGPTKPQSIGTEREHPPKRNAAEFFANALRKNRETTR